MGAWAAHRLWSRLGFRKPANGWARQQATMGAVNPAMPGGPARLALHSTILTSFDKDDNQCYIFDLATRWVVPSTSDHAADPNFENPHDTILPSCQCCNQLFSCLPCGFPQLRHASGCRICAGGHPTRSILMRSGWNCARLGLSYRPAGVHTNTTQHNTTLPQIHLQVSTELHTHTGVTWSGFSPDNYRF
eukprot:334139-Prorocentrum_minimum.AAC.2